MRYRGAVVVLVTLVAAGCSNEDPEPEAVSTGSTGSSQSGEFEGSCDGSIRFGGVVYVPVGGSNIEGIPKRPQRGRYLGVGTRRPCDDTPNDGDSDPGRESLRVWSMVGVPVQDAVMAGPGPEPMGAIPY